MLTLEILSFPVLMMMGLAFLYSLTLRTARNPVNASIKHGLLFGAAVVLAMSMPIRIADGVMFDLRGLLTGMAVVFGGWIAGIVTLVIGLSYRMYIGGAGALSGCVGLLIAFAIGPIWVQVVAGRIKSAAVSDMLFGLCVSLSLAGVFLLPFDIAYAIAMQLFAPITLCNTVGAIALGFALRRERQYVRDAEQLRIHASVDPLTKVLNRRGAAAEVKVLHSRATGGQAIFYFDIDHFKLINDRHGHAAGDKVLATVANRIENCVRGKVVFCRHGGDEFTLYMPDVGEASVEAIADRFLRAISDRPIYFNGQAMALSISIGAYWSSKPVSFEDMLVQADTQLLQAKAQGRNQVSYGSDAQQTQGRDAGWVVPTEAAVEDLVSG